jgi:hypothetical protein
MLTSPVFIQPIPILLFMGEGKALRGATPYSSLPPYPPSPPPFLWEGKGKMNKDGCCRVVI